MTTSCPDTLQFDLRTVEEANRMVPLLKVIGQDIVEVWDDITQCRKTVEAAKAMDHDINEVKNQLDSHVEQINKCICEIEQLNCVTSELRRGIIMIPSWFENRKISLCYRTGEDSVEYWCELYESYCQRKQIVTNQDFYWDK